jgi:hypothetical protein
MLDAAKSRADTLADQIKSTLNELSETLNEQETHIETLIAECPIATMASAFALPLITIIVRSLKAPATATSEQH